MQIYDAHVHFLWETSFEPFLPRWRALQTQGLRGMAVIIMGYHLADTKRCLALIPTAYHDQVGADRGFFSEPPDLSSCVPRSPDGLQLFPYLDSRFMEEGRSDLTPFRDAGFRGLKILYVPEEDRENGMIGWEALFHRPLSASEDLTSRLVDQAASFGWPVIFHADLHRYGAFVEDLLAAYPSTPFILPHLGFSRKAVAGILERQPHVSTDVSSLLPFMKRVPEAYADFIAAYPDRVLFGTDATWGWPELEEEYLAFLPGLIRDEEVLERLFAGNYLRIHEQGVGA